MTAGAETGAARRLLSLCVERARRFGSWIDDHPAQAYGLALLLVLALVGAEVNYWPSNDFPGALWHKSPRGDDIELAQANAAKAGWKELWGYWSGPMIHGHGYYRPITSWLFVLQYRMFGTADGKWAFLNLGLHLAVCLLLVWAGGALAGGSKARRLMVGVGASLLLGAPLLADRTIQYWICGWWPCQSEMLSLLGGLTLLSATVRFVETGRGRWLTLCVVAMIVGILCKEMTYVAALGACLLLLRHPKRWWGAIPIVVPALALFLFRMWAIRNVAVKGGIPMKSLIDHASYEVVLLGGQLAMSWMHFAALAVGLLTLRVLLPRWNWMERGVVAICLQVGIISLVLGLPWEAAAFPVYKTLIGMGLALALLFGILRAVRRWPIAELCVVWALTQLPAIGFMPIFAWYRYWGDAFGSLLVVIGFWEVIAWGCGKLNLCPRQSTPQTPESLPPAAGGSLATGPSAA